MNVYLVGYLLFQFIAVKDGLHIFLFIGKLLYLSVFFFSQESLSRSCSNYV